MRVNKSINANKQHNCCYLFIYFFILWFCCFFCQRWRSRCDRGRSPLLPRRNHPSTSLILCSTLWEQLDTTIICEVLSLGHSLQKNTLARKGKENKIAALYFKDSEEAFSNCFFFFFSFTLQLSRSEPGVNDDLWPPSSQMVVWWNMHRTGSEQSETGSATEPRFLFNYEKMKLVFVCMSVTHQWSLHCCFFVCTSDAFLKQKSHWLLKREIISFYIYSYVVIQKSVYLPNISSKKNRAEWRPCIHLVLDRC